MSAVCTTPQESFFVACQLHAHPLGFFSQLHRKCCMTRVSHQHRLSLLSLLFLDYYICNTIFWRVDTQYQCVISITVRLSFPTKPHWFHHHFVCWWRYSRGKSFWLWSALNGVLEYTYTYIRPIPKDRRAAEDHLMPQRWCGTESPGKHVVLLHLPHPANMHSDASVWGNMTTIILGS